MSPDTTLTPDRNRAEFDYTDADFERVRQLIRQRAGIHLQPGKQAMVYSRLARRVRDLGLPSVKQYLDGLEAGHAGAGQAAEWQEFVNCLTTNLTAFFREPHHFEALVDDLRARAATAAGRPLRVWCSASSTGEEPYSIAMVLAETLGTQGRASVLASDIDSKVLGTAQQAVYDAQARGLSEHRLKLHCLRGTGRQAGLIRVKPEVARLVSFRTFNLMNPRWDDLGEPFDLVFCRNVMIYFDAATQRQVLERMHGVMRPGSLLYVGHSENFTDARQHFRLRGKTVYERV